MARIRKDVRSAYSYRANTESENRRRGRARRSARVATPAPMLELVPVPRPALIIGGWDRNHPPTNGARECARRLRQMNGRV